MLKALTKELSLFALQLTKEFKSLYLTQELVSEQAFDHRDSRVNLCQAYVLCEIYVLCVCVCVWVWVWVWVCVCLASEDAANVIWWLTTYLSPYY